MAAAALLLRAQRASPRAARRQNHMGQLKVLDDDNIFLPLQERRVVTVFGGPLASLACVCACVFSNRKL